MTLRSIALVAVLAVAAASALVIQHRPSAPAMELGSAMVLPAPRSLPEFALVDQHDRPLTRASLKGGWTLAFAGFTHCPDICPTTLTVLAAVDARLQADGLGVRPLFLSVDPERDDPDTLAAYLRHFSPRLVGATGQPAEIDKLMAGLGLVYLRVPGGAGQYSIDHSTALVLVDPRAEVVAYFRPPLDPDAIASDLKSAIGTRP